MRPSIFYILFIIPVLFSACAKEPAKVFQEVSLERWAVSGDSISYEKDSIIFLETKTYNELGILKGHLFYDNQKQLSAKEIRIFDENSIGPVGSQYKDPNDNILSYYTFKTDSEGNVIESKAFDASNDQLLRQETFEFKAKHLQKKEVKNSNGVPVRIFKYTLDNYGNEQQVEVLQPDGTAILTEVFNITKYDSEHNWIEKWGFVNDQPFSFVARRIKYQ